MLPGYAWINRAQRSLGLAKQVRWRGLSRPRSPPFGSGEILDVGIPGRALDQTWSGIELPQPNSWARLVGIGFSLLDLLRRFRLCPRAGLRLGHFFFRLIRWKRTVSGCESYTQL